MKKIKLLISSLVVLIGSVSAWAQKNNQQEVEAPGPRIVSPITSQDLDAGSPEDLARRTSARKRFNVAHHLGPVSILGDYDLRPSTAPGTGVALDFPTAGPEFNRHRYGSFFLQRPGAAGLEFIKTQTPTGEFKVKAVKDLLYAIPLLDGQRLVGQRFLPIVNRFDQGRDGITYPPLGRTADGQMILGSQTIDKLLFETYYGVNTFASTNERTTEPTTDAEKITEAIRQEELSRKRPVFAVLGYTHPQYWKGSLQDVGQDYFFKTQGAMGHMGSYMGFGFTRNSPATLYDYTWGVKLGNDAEPAIAYTVKMRANDGPLGALEKSESLLQNLRIWTILLNEGVKFPADYTQDKFVAVNLREVLAFARGWLDEDWIRPDIFPEAEVRPLIERAKREPEFKRSEEYKKKTFYYVLRHSAEWANYCAEHITMILNIGSNVLANAESLREIFGERDPDTGEEFPQRFLAIMKAKYAENLRKRLIPAVAIAQPALREMPVVPHGSFAPLYAGFKRGEKISGHIQGVGPIYYRVGERQTRTVRNQEIVEFTGGVLELGRALVWKPQTTADILSAFVTTYVPWQDVGAPMSSSIVLNFAPVAKDRLGLELDRFLELTVPIVFAMNWYELGYKNIGQVSDLAALNTQYEGQIAQVLNLLKVSPLYANEANLEKVRGALQREKEKFSTEKARLDVNKLIAQLQQVLDPEQRREVLGTFYKDYVKGLMAEARSVDPVESPATGNEYWRPVRVKWYSPPAIVQRILNGLHPQNPRMIFEAAGTVVHASMVVENRDAVPANNQGVDTALVGRETLTQRDASEGLN